MRCKIVFQDNSWIIGRRVSLWEQFISRVTETAGTHHWWVEDFSWEIRADMAQVHQLDKRRIAIPINSMKYMVFL
jgi:hypothetical protein